MEHNKPNWDKLQAISVLTSDSPYLGPALKKNPYIYMCVCVCVSSIVVWHCVLSVVSVVVFLGVSEHKVFRSAGSGLAALFLGGPECICWHCWYQIFNDLVHRNETQSFAPLPESWEVMLVDEIHYQARGLGL